MQCPIEQQSHHEFSQKGHWPREAKMHASWLFQSALLRTVASSDYAQIMVNRPSAWEIPA